MTKKNIIPVKKDMLSNHTHIGGQTHTSAHMRANTHAHTHRQTDAHILYI